MLKKISSGDNLIISLGGGTICSGSNIAFLKNNGQIIYLKTSVESVYKRVLHKNDRPVLNTDELSGVPKEEVLLKLNAIFDVRKPYYEQADFTIETENIPIGRTIDNLARYINNHIKGQRFEKDNH
jgi:shikimate kinase